MGVPMSVINTRISTSIPICVFVFVLIVQDYIRVSIGFMPYITSEVVNMTSFYHKLKP